MEVSSFLSTKYVVKIWCIDAFDKKAIKNTKYETKKSLNQNYVLNITLSEFKTLTQAYQIEQKILCYLAEQFQLPYDQLIAASGAKCLYQQQLETKEYQKIHATDVKFWGKYQGSGSTNDFHYYATQLESLAEIANVDTGPKKKAVDFQYFEDIWSFEEFKLKHLYLYILDNRKVQADTLKELVLKKW